MKIGSGTHFHEKDTPPDGCLAEERGELIKLSDDDFEFSRAQLSNFLLGRIKDAQVPGTVLTLLRFNIALQFHRLSAMALNEETHRTNLDQEQNFPTKRT